MTHLAISPGEVAVITGAGLGIGRAMAKRFVAEGMAVALLDIDVVNLHDARAEIGGETEAILCDVAEVEALEVAHARVMETWGKPPTVLVNNAVTRLGQGFWAPLEVWRRALDINLMGVVNGVRAFVPAMTESGRPGLVINVGSKQGITNPPGHPVYNMAKAAVKSFTEGLEHELRQDPDRQVSAHLLVPGFTATGTSGPKAGAWSPSQVVDHMMTALANRSFYIVCPDDEVTPSMDRSRILWGAEDITEDRPALSRWHPEFAEAFARKDGR